MSVTIDRHLYLCKDCGEEGIEDSGRGPVKCPTCHYSGDIVQIQ
jgi:DNA-directed RNA polymerase subunit RPC12/RpoP